jgi:hypothetical protein
MENTDAAIDPGAECQPILAGFQLGGGIFLLTFPFYGINSLFSMPS